MILHYMLHEFYSDIEDQSVFTVTREALKSPIQEMRITHLFQ
jgi:hypothetical protein